MKFALDDSPSPGLQRKTRFLTWDTHSASANQVAAETPCFLIS